MHPSKTYAGIDKDEGAGMSPTAKIVRDGWAFGLIPETETCEGWQAHRIEALWVQVNAEWEKYGFRVGEMPEDLRARYLRIQNAAVERAKAQGWTGAGELEDDS